MNNKIIIKMNKLIEEIPMRKKLKILKIFKISYVNGCVYVYGYYGKRRRACEILL
jgi:hypothetical protein